MVYLELFLSFMKIGFTSFGGMSMIPLILDEMQVHGWMTQEDLTNLVGIAEMTPGPLGVNCATFAGMQAAGVMGGLAAVFGVLMPAFTLTLAVAVFFKRFRDSKVVADIMGFVKPVCIAMIIAVMITLSGENYFRNGAADLRAVAIGVLSLYLILKRKWSVPKVIGSAALLGLVFYGIIPLP